MGCHPNIDSTKFPKQGRMLGRTVLVCFNYDTSKKLKGLVIRNDIEEPGRGIIALEDGRYIMDSECQYSPIREEKHNA